MIHDLLAAIQPLLVSAPRSIVRGAASVVVPVLLVGGHSIVWANGLQPSQTKVTVTGGLRSRPQTSSRGGLATAVFRADTSLALVDVIVLDDRGRPATGLQKNDFRLFEDKIEQSVTIVSSEDLPVSVGILFDTSGSMELRLSHSKQSIASFLSTANPEDEFSLIQFSDRPVVSVPFTRSIEELQNRSLFTNAKGSTALFDAVYFALNQLKHANNGRKALLVVSDGADNFSRYSEKEVLALTRETDALIYSIGVMEAYPSRSQRSKIERQTAVLKGMAEDSGGKYYPMRTTKELASIIHTISSELHSQYTLGYVPTNREQSGKYRRLKVELIRKDGLPRLRAYHRLGYYD